MNEKEQLNKVQRWAIKHGSHDLTAESMAELKAITGGKMNRKDTKEMIAISRVLLEAHKRIITHFDAQNNLSKKQWTDLVEESFDGLPASVWLEFIKMDATA
jgi:hypothetical protein